MQSIRSGAYCRSQPLNSCAASPSVRIARSQRSGCLAPAASELGSQELGRRGGLVARAAASSRGILILPGLGNNSSDYNDLAQSLTAMGLTVETAAVSRPDWSRNAAALTDGNWWKGTLKPRPAVNWYLDKVNTAMQSLKEKVDGAPITILTHSAGGWLGRVYLKDFGTTGVDRFVSLGSPHQPPPAGILDQTRGILAYCADTLPGAYHPEIKYVTVASNFVRGLKLGADGPLLAKFAGAGYQQVCGEAEVEGDFIVPITSAHLEGALNVNLEGAFHSPLGTKLSFLGPWYGSPEFLSSWVHHVGVEAVQGELVASSSSTTAVL